MGLVSRPIPQAKQKHFEWIMTINTKHLGRCIQTLESSLTLLQRSEPGSIEYEIYRNATVKGFELAM